MKVKHLESLLQNVEAFSKPKITLEQYCTSPHISANILHKIYTDFDEDLESCSLLDMGSGSGMFTIGASALGAAFSMGMEIDGDAISDAHDNIERVFQEDNPCIELLQIDVCNDFTLEKFEKQFDVVVMNPPFGTKRNSGIDVKFLERALQLSSNSVYSLHKSATRQFIIKKIEKLGLNVNVLSQLRFDLPATYKCHKNESRDIAVDLIRFTFD